jgi:hypothetical protein
MATSETYPVYEARVGALGSVRAWHLPDINTFCFTYFNGEDYTPVFLSEEAAYYTWLFLSMMHPEANGHVFPSKCGKGYTHKTKSAKCKPSKPATTKKKKLVKKK